MGMTMQFTRDKISAAWAVDDALCPRQPSEAPANARYVGYQAGHGVVWCAVWSYLGVQLDECEAEEISNDYMFETGWTRDENINADYVL